MIGHDHFEFLGSRLFDKSAEMLDDPKRRDSLHGVLNDLLRKFDFENNGWPGRDCVLFTAYEYLSCAGVDSEQIALVLALLDGGISVIDTVEKNRADCLATLEGERAGMETSDGLYEPEDFDRIDGDISDVRDALFFQLFRKLGLEERHETAPFEGAYVRMKKMKGGKNWDVRRRKFSRIFGITERAVGAAKAWESPSLSEKGGGTVDELIEGLREKVLGAVEISPEPFSPDVLKRLYELFSDGKDLEFLKGLEPAEFYLVDGEVSLELRQWIYAVMMLVSPEGASDARKLIAEGLSCGIGKIASCTAYLTGKLRENASGERLKQIENIEKHIASKSVAETTDSDPDYDNEAKNKGWREPERRMIETAWGKEVPLRGKRMLIMETPRLLEWGMLKEMGGEEQNLTIVERDPEKAAELKKLLPEANIIEGTLEDWLSRIFFERLKGRGEELERKGIKLGASLKLGDLVTPPNFYKLKIPPALFEWAKTDPRFTCYGDDIKEFLEDPYFWLSNSIDVPIDPTAGFDLVSLDTKTKFSALQMMCRMFMKLGLLNDDAVLCTNCLGQRDDAADKRDLGITFLSAHHVEMYGRNWMAELAKPLRERRGGVSLGLMSILKDGYGQAGATFISNPDSALFRTFDVQSLLTENLVRQAVEQFLSSFNPLNDQGQPVFSCEQFLPIFKALTGGHLTQLLLRRRCRRVFRPMAERLGFKRRVGKVNRIVKFDAATQGVLTGNTAFADSVADLGLVHLNRSFTVESHEACRYRGSNVFMLSDFFHAKRRSPLIGLSDRTLDELVAAIAEERLPRGLQSRVLLDAFQRYTEGVGKYEKLKGECLDRKDV